MCWKFQVVLISSWVDKENLSALSQLKILNRKSPSVSWFSAVSVITFYDTILCLKRHDCFLMSSHCYVIRSVFKKPVLPKIFRKSWENLLIAGEIIFCKKALLKNFQMKVSGYPIKKNNTQMGQNLCFQKNNSEMYSFQLSSISHSY